MRLLVAFFSLPETYPRTFNVLLAVAFAIAAFSVMHR